MSRIALPPGIYRIVMGTTQAVTSPATNGAPLTIAAKNNSSSQQWLISGNGVCTSMSTAGLYAGVSGSPPGVTRQNAPYGWIINAMMDMNGVITGWIMVNDTRKLYWGSTGTSVTLVASPTSWLFELVA